MVGEGVQYTVNLPGDLIFQEQGCFSVLPLSSLRQDALVSILISLQVGKVEAVAAPIFQGFQMV